MPKKKKPAKPDGDPEGGGEEGSIKSTLTAAMPGMDFDFGQVFQAQKLEGFLKGVMGKVHAQDETINALKQELNSRPTQKEMDSQRSLLFEHVSDSLKKKADTEIVEQVRAMLIGLQSPLPSWVHGPQKPSVDSLEHATYGLLVS